MMCGPVAEAVHLRKMCQEVEEGLQVTDLERPGVHAVGRMSARWAQATLSSCESVVVWPHLAHAM